MYRLRGMNIIEMAFRLAATVAQYQGKARYFFYEVMLSDRTCPTFEGGLVMTADGQCRCVECGKGFDPTVAFQRCSDCRGRLHLAIRRYRCRECGADVASRFLFDGLVFDPDYFRQKMAEHRQRRKDLRDRLRAQVAGARSLPVVFRFKNIACSRPMPRMPAHHRVARSIRVLGQDLEVVVICVDAIPLFAGSLTQNPRLTERGDRFGRCGLGGLQQLTGQRQCLDRVKRQLVKQPNRRNGDLNLGQHVLTMYAEQGEQALGHGDAIIGRLANAFEVEASPSLPVAFGSHGR